MAVDYTALASTATTLISDNGRNVTLTKKSRTIANASQPWRGTTTTAIATVVAKAVIFDVTDEQISNETTREDDRDLILRGDKMAVVAASSLASASATDLVGYDTFIDGADTYQIVSVETVRPGPTTVVYLMQLRV